MRCAAVVGLMLGSVVLQGCPAMNPGGRAPTMTDAPNLASDQGHGPGSPQRVHGARVYLRPIHVTPSDGPGFAVGALGVPARVVLPAQQAASVTVHVVSPLAFEAEARAEDVTLRLTRSAEVAGGRVRLAAGALVRAAWVAPAGVTAEVVVAPGVIVHGVPLAADLLTLDLAPATPGVAAVGAGAWVPRGSIVHLHAIAGVSAPLAVETSMPFGLVFEQRGDERDGLLPVEARWGNGAALAGRVSLAELRRLAPDEMTAPALVEDSPPGEVNECGVRTTAPGMIRGMRRVAGGSVVYAEPGRGAWARVADSVDLEVEYAPGSRYAAIVQVPGIVQLGQGCSEPMRAWVEMSAVTTEPRAR